MAEFLGMSREWLPVLDSHRDTRTPPLTPRESEILALLTSDVTPISDAVEQVVTMLQEARQ